MKAELTLPQELVDQIADRVLEKIMPLLKGVNNTHEDQIVDIRGAAEFLTTSKQQIYQWVSNAKHGLGNFPYKKLGKQLRFSKNELIEWMESNGRR